MLPLPGMSGMLAAGPIIGALGRGRDMTAQLRALGVTRIAARNLTDRVRAGNILVAVRVETREQLATVAKILRQAGAQEVCCAGAAAINHARGMMRHGHGHHSHVRWQQAVVQAQH